MIDTYIKPSDWGWPLRPAGSPARSLVIDDCQLTGRMLRQTLSWHGLGQPEQVACGDDALDALGAARQRMDLVLICETLVDAPEVDVVAVMRHQRSPVRVVRYGAFAPGEVRDWHRDLGVAAYIDLGSRSGIARQVDAVLRAPVTIGEIMTRRLVPATIDAVSAALIYGAAPGETFKKPIE